MRTRMRTGILVVVIVALALLAGAASGRGAAPNKLATLKLPTTVGVAVWGQEWIAFQQGFFKKYGLDVEFVNAPVTTSLLLASLESGQINVWANGVGGVGGASQNGHPNQFVCGSNNGQEQFLVVRSDSNYP